MLEKAAEASAAFRRLDQDQTDHIVRAVYLAAFNERVRLAKMAREETAVGIWQHKVIKNVIATHLVYNDIRSKKTVGVIAEDQRNGIVEIVQPVGPILGLIPVTNPTATVFFKALISLKTRNPLIVSPHNAAKRCTAEAARVCYEAALEAGAPKNCIQWLEKSTPKSTALLMSHPRLALIIATGTSGLVREAYSSGTPVIGVGPGNVPVYVSATADVAYAVQNIIESKTFDNGTVCASEQAVVVERTVSDKVIREFEKQRAYFLSSEEIDKVGKIAFDRKRGTMAAGVVGQPVDQIAQSAGIEVPKDTTLLIAQLEGVGPEFPLSAEILAPILAFYIEDDFDESIRRCTEITDFGGRGHTAVIYSNEEESIKGFSRAIDAGRILVNTPSTFGALGGMFNSLSPSFTLSCGSGGNNTTTDNITVKHLLNINRLTRRRPNPRWMAFDKKRFLDESLKAEDIEKEQIG